MNINISRNKLLGICKLFIRKNSLIASASRINNFSQTNFSNVLYNCEQQIRSIHTSQQKTVKFQHIPSEFDKYVFPEPPDLISEDEHETVIQKVNECISDPNAGRCFAVVVIGGQQFKVTNDDLVRIDGLLPLDVGTTIRLEKVLLVGGQDFTLVGRPLVRRSLVNIKATVVEKTKGEDKVIQRFLPRSRFQRRYLFTQNHTVLRINSIDVQPGV